MNYYCDECHGFIDKFGFGHKRGCSKIKRLEVVEQKDHVAQLEADNARLREAGEALYEIAENVYYKTDNNPIRKKVIKLRMAKWREACGEGRPQEEEDADV